jgi:primase-polymerase (primpol)-like protein
VDIDKCIDLATGEIAPWAQAIIDRLNTYTELSQSQTGLHIIGTGTLPPGRRRQDRIEMYDEGRFFALTGQHYPGTSLTIEDRQSVLDALHRDLFPPTTPPCTPAPRMPSAMSLTDSELLSRMFAARNGAMVQHLWAGDTSGYASHSEADLALCSYLAFWTGGDASRIDALFRQSGLYRIDKWNRHDYRERTIGTALASARFSEKPLSPRPWHQHTQAWTGALTTVDVREVSSWQK